MLIPAYSSTMSVIKYLKKAMSENRMEQALVQEQEPLDVEFMQSLQQRHAAMADSLEYYENYWSANCEQGDKMTLEEIYEDLVAMSRKRLDLLEVVDNIDSQFTQIRLRQAALHEELLTADTEQLLRIQKELQDIETLENELHSSEYEAQTEIEAIETNMADMRQYISIYRKVESAAVLNDEEDEEYTDELM